MFNYNITIDLKKIQGAKVVDMEGERGVFIPINNRIGTVTDAYYTQDGYGGEFALKQRKGVLLRVVALGINPTVNNQTHLLKAYLYKETVSTLMEEQLRRMPWIGNMQNWE